MDNAPTPDTVRPRPTVFLSYASEDRDAARLLGETLPQYGLEVWYDESELGGGDAWDQKIRRQIRECDYFMALVSAHTEARPEGYFRREWRLAVERTLDMADDHLFLVPIVIDDTSEAGARVPERFLAVQWLKAPDGKPTPALATLCRRLATDRPDGATVPVSAPERVARAKAVPRQLSFPEFPQQEPGQKAKFAFAVAGWALRCAWVVFGRLPRWVRIVAIVWLCILVAARGCTPRHRDPVAETAAAAELRALAEQYHGNSNKADVGKLGEQVAREFSKGRAPPAAGANVLLAIPFSAPTDDPAAERLADSAFAMVYGRIALTHHDQLGLSPDAVPGCDRPAVLERGRSQHAHFVVCGMIETQAGAPALTVGITKVADGSILWSKSYAVTGADPAGIANEVAARVPRSEDDEE